MFLNSQFNKAAKKSTSCCLGLLILLLFNSCNIDVSKIGRYGFIDKTGKPIIDSTYIEADSFSDSLAYVKINYDRDGFIDKAGNLVLVTNKFKPYTAINTIRFNEGLALVAVNDTNKIVYVDKTGKIVIDKNFFAARNFSDGLACISNTIEYTGYVYNMKTGEHVSDEYNQYWSYIDRTGKVIIKTEYTEAGDFSEGLAWVMTNESKYGYINKKGEMVIELQSHFKVGNFSEGLAWIKTNQGKYGYIDQTGRLIIEPKHYNAVGNFSEGLAWVITNEKKYGYIDKSGKMIIEPQKHSSINYYDVGNFSEGLAWVRKSKNSFGYINKTGKLVIGAHFQNAKDFSEGCALVQF